MALVPGLAVGGTTELAIVAPSGAVLRRLLRPGPDPVAAGDREGRQGLMAEGKGEVAQAVPRANVPLAAGGGRRAAGKASGLGLRR